MKADSVQRSGLFRSGKIGPFKMIHICILVVVVICAAVGFRVYQSSNTPTQAVAAGTPVAVKIGTLSTSVTASGSVIATKTADLTFDVSGKIANISVNVGDTVKSGQELGKLDTSALEIALTQAQSKLKSAQIELQQAQKGGTADEIAAAQSSYDSAVAQYQQTAKGSSDSDIKAAEQTVASAQVAYDKAVSTLNTVQANPDPDGIQAATLALEQAKDSLWSTQVSRDGTCATGKEYQCQSGNANVASAELSVTQAQTTLQNAQSSAGSALATAQKNVASAKLALDAAQAKLTQVQSGATQASLLSAASAVSSEKSSLVSTTSATPGAIALAQEKVKTAEIAVQQAEANLKSATLFAPFDGTVSAIGGNVGETSTISATNFTLVDTGAIRIDVNVPEADIAKVVLGQSATITSDSLSGSYQGKVTAIAPTATVSSGVASYVVSLSVDTKGKTIQPGISITAAIVTQQKDNVLIVPSKAIKTASGTKTVQVVTGTGVTETRTVQVGLTGDAGVEITSGLNEGDKVMVSGTTTTTSKTGTSQNGGMPGGGMGGPPPGM
jgi:multidrug efflux pump subunit AcrA (membrane-fusion protein)